MREHQDDQNAAPAAPAAAEVPTEPAPGKVRVVDKTFATWDEGQKGALQQANMERTARGLPPWEIADYVRVHPGKFPDVDHELDHAEHVERNKKAVLPHPSQRVDQRPAS